MMKKLFVISALFFTSTAVMATTAPVTSQPATGGFQGELVVPAITTVAQANEASDDERVALTGYIMRALGDEEYLFKDATGAEITIEIDQEDWRGVNATPETKVQILGEVDKDWFERKVDVDSVTLAG